MPILTRDTSNYGGDVDHFENVLRELHEPALKRAGFEVVGPIAYGESVIHEAIVQHLSHAELVLVDLSECRPNVLVEMGIRIALNKPICVVIDHATPMPFDLMSLNSWQYDAHRGSIYFGSRVDDLRQHIEACVQTSAGKNSMWQTFGVLSAASLAEPEIKEALALIATQVTHIGRRVEDSVPPAYFPLVKKADGEKIRDLAKALRIAIFQQTGEICEVDCKFGDAVIRLSSPVLLDPETIDKLIQLAQEEGYRLEYCLNRPEHRTAGAWCWSGIN